MNAQCGEVRTTYVLPQEKRKAPPGHISEGRSGQENIRTVGFFLRSDKGWIGGRKSTPHHLHSGQHHSVDDMDDAV